MYLCSQHFASTECVQSNDRKSTIENGRTYCLKYLETRAGSMLFLSNTYFMTHLTLYLIFKNHVLLGENFATDSDFLPWNLKLLWQMVNSFINLE